MKIPAVFSEEYVVASPARNMLKLECVATEAMARDLVEIRLPHPVTESELERVHAMEYIDAFMSGRRPLCESNNLPWSKELVRAVLMMNGGMLTASAMAQDYGVAVNIANGFHHASYEKGEAYCTFNGLALVAACFPDKDVFVLDLDQHGGNGTEDLTYRLENLTNFSIHGSPFGWRGRS